jgi:hypothetical protein
MKRPQPLETRPLRHPSANLCTGVVEPIPGDRPRARDRETARVCRGRRSDPSAPCPSRPLSRFIARAREERPALAGFRVSGEHRDVADLVLAADPDEVDRAEQAARPADRGGERSEGAGPVLRRTRMARNRSSDQVAVFGTEASDTNSELVRAWCDLAIDSAIVAPNEARTLAAEGRHRAREARRPPNARRCRARPTRAPMARTARLSGLEHRLGAGRRAPQAPHRPPARPCGDPAPPHGAPQAQLRPSIARAAARRQAPSRELGHRRVPMRNGGGTPPDPAGDPHEALVPARRGPRPGADPAGRVRPPARRNRRRGHRRRSPCGRSRGVAAAAPTGSRGIAKTDNRPR